MVHISAMPRLLIYPDRWTLDIDSLMLSLLIKMKKIMGHKGNTFSSDYIEELKNAVEQTVGECFEWFEIVDCLHLFERRYASFKEVLNMHGTVWNETNNVVVISDSSWEAALQRNDLLAAYWSSGDLAYHELHTLYTMDDVDEAVEESNIINKSSDSSSLDTTGGRGSETSYGKANTGASASRSSCRSKAHKTNK